MFHFLRKLKSFQLDNELLCLFYSAMVQSVICYGLVCWWSCLTVKDRLRLNRVRRAAERIVGMSLKTLNELYNERAISKFKHIRELEGSCELNDMIFMLRSGKRIQSIRCRTTRFSNSFLPTAVRLFNNVNKV